MKDLTKFSRNLFLGKQQNAVELHGSKMVMLRGQFALLAIFLGVLYATIVMARGEFQYLPWHTLLVVGGAAAFYLNRTGKHLASSLTLYVLTNSFVFLFTSVNRPQDGMFFYYFITNTLAIILVGIRYYILIIVLVLITLSLAVIAYLHPIMLIPVPKDITAGVEQVIFMINLVISLLFGSYVIISLMRENALVENKLISSHKEVSKINEELDRFVYSASHDMRAPLSSLLGLINIAEKSKTPEETALCLTMMHERVNVMDGFIREITDYSRNARTAVEKKSIYVLPCVNAVLSNLKFLFEREKINITVAISPDVVVVTDESRFKIVLNNLISNAIKYYDPAKANPFITIRCTTSKGHFIFAVEDNGLGIGKEHLNRIFDMFYRATTSSEGSGLGLYIVNETMERLNGTISVVSTEGVGSTFTIKLPVAEN